MPRPVTERQLWYTVFALLAIAVVLVFAAFQFGWFTVRYEGDIRVTGHFHFEEYRLAVEDQEPQALDYGEGFAFAGLMQRTGLLWTLGFVALLGYAAALVAYFFGRLRSVKPIFAAWLATALLLLGAFLSYSFAAGDAADADTERIAASFGIPLQADNGFWGQERVEGGTLASRPGAGWFLALLGLANVAGSNAVLLRVPRRVEAGPEPRAAAR